MTDTQIRQQILRKIRRIPAIKLKDLNEYLSRLEQSIEKSSKIHSYAGCWKNLDESAFVELTDKLIENRNKNSRRFNEEGIN